MSKVDRLVRGAVRLARGSKARTETAKRLKQLRKAKKEAERAAKFGIPMAGLVGAGTTAGAVELKESLGREKKSSVNDYLISGFLSKIEEEI